MLLPLILMSDFVFNLIIFVFYGRNSGVATLNAIDNLSLSINSKSIQFGILRVACYDIVRAAYVRYMPIAWQQHSRRHIICYP